MLRKGLSSPTYFVVFISLVFIRCEPVGAFPSPDKGAKNEDQSREEADFYSALTLDDATLSMELTRTFQENLLPNLKRGIPEIGVRSIDPIFLPNFTLTNFDLGFLRCTSNVHTFIALGLSDISNSSIVIDTQSQKLYARFEFPKVEGTTGTGTTCFLFGTPLWKLREGGGSLRYRFDGLSLGGTFKIRPTPSEIVRLEKMDVDVKGARAEGHGTLPAFIEAVTNVLQGHFGLYFFRFAVRLGLAEASPQIFNTFMDANAWEVVLGDYI